jgi:uncharacterized protein YutE (UPF0331/DUF86 family)
MSPLNKDSISDKLFKLGEAIKIIEELLAKSDVMTDQILKSSLYFNMVISIEIILDIGNHILAEVFYKAENNYKDIILGLGRKNVISMNFAEQNQDMGDFRNKIIHEYDKIDDELVRTYVVKAPEIFKTFATCFVCFLKENTGE